MIRLPETECSFCHRKFLARERYRVFCSVSCFRAHQKASPPFRTGKGWKYDKALLKKRLVEEEGVFNRERVSNRIRFLASASLNPELLSQIELLLGAK